MSGGDDGAHYESGWRSLENLSPREPRGGTGETSFATRVFGTRRKALTKFSGWFS